MERVAFDVSSQNPRQRRLHTETNRKRDLRNRCRNPNLSVVVDRSTLATRHRARRWQNCRCALSTE